MTESRTVTHRITVQAPADRVYALVADSEAGPRHFPPQVHAEVVHRDFDGDVVRRWVYVGGALRSWNARRRLDPAGRRIVFSHEPPTPPVREQRGEWRFTALSDGSTLVEMTHIVTADDAAVAERITEDHDRTAPIQLGGYQKVAELGPRLPELVVPYADSVLLDGTVEDVFAALLADGTWADGPVTTTPLAADADLITFGGADSQPVRCLRLLFPADRIVFKFLDVPGWLGAHVGTWRLRPEGDRVHVRREHFATLSPRALAEPPHALAELRDRAARHLHEDASRVATAVRRSLPEPAVSAVSA